MDTTPANDVPAIHQTEYDALLSLLMAHALPGDGRAAEVARWMAASALEPGHLWRAMGLSSRAELRTLFETHFPGLAAGNTKDMRWKKYLYKLLCGWPGFSG